MVDPNDSETIYAGGRFEPRSDDLGNLVDGNGGIYKSTNGGLIWTTIDSGIPLTPPPFVRSFFQTVRDLAIDPTDPSGGTLYASTNDLVDLTPGSIYKTTDGGLNGFFSGVGLESRDVRDLAVDPVTGHVYAAVTDPLGNGDGIRDAEQADVASPKVLVGGRGSEITITASVTPAFATAGACDRIENSFGITQLQGVPAERRYDMPFNGLYLRIPDCQAAEVTLIYHGRSFSDDPSWQIRGYGLAFPNEDSNDWFRIEPAGVSGTTWTFTLEDGALGDATPEDGIIVFTGAAKQLTERFFADGLEAE